MSKIILPDDPDFDKPIIMGNPFEVDPNRDLNKQAITPGTKQAAMDKQRAVESPGTFKYAETLASSAPELWHHQMMKTSQEAGVSNMMTQPMWFSPLHTPQNWQVASKRREVYQWSFVCSDHQNASFLVNYGDFSLISMKKAYAEWSHNTSNKNQLYIQNDKGEKSQPDICTKRYVEKKVNTIKILGQSHPIEVTHDHKCIVIKKEHVKCTNRQLSKSKNCISDVNSPGCIKAKCNQNETIDYPISTVNAEDIRKGDFVLCPFPTEIKKSIIKTKEQARFAGHLAADGHISKNPKHPGTNVCMNIDEIEYVLPSIKSVYESYGAVAKLEKCRSPKLKSVRTGKVKLYREFSSNLITGKRENKKFTEEVMLLNPKLQMHVLGAYIQSDGSFNKVNEQIEITTVSKHLANQLQIMFFRCGILSFSSLQNQSSSRKTFKTKNKRYFISVPKTFVYTLKDYVPGKIPSNVYTPFDKCIYKDSKFKGISNVYFKKNDHEISRINNRFFWKNYVVSPVVSNTSRDYKGDVYDIRVPPTFAITVNGVAIHQCRFFYENEPKVAAAIDFYSRFPMNGFKLECLNPKILKYYAHHIVKKLNLNERFKEISSEYYMIGDVFVHTDIKCEICGGVGADPDTGEQCDHPGGTLSRIFIMNPDWIEVQRSPLTDEPLIVLIPDEELQQIVHKRQPKAIFDRIPDNLKQLILARAPIPLSNRTISHLKHMNVPYGTYGTSIIRRLFTTLAYKTKIMTANWIVAERLILPVRVVKIGSDNRPAATQDIADVQTQLANVANDPNMTIVTHHNFEYDWYGTQGKILQVTQEMEHIDKELLDGLMLNQALLNGEMCHSEDTEVLTDSGFKSYKKVHQDDKIACYNVYTNRVEYDFPTALHEYDYDGELIHFSGKRLDIKVTPSHKMLVSWDKNSWKTTTANSVKSGMRFIGASEFENITDIQYPVIHNDDEYSVDLVEKFIPLDIFAKFAGYYISEGSSYAKKSNYHLHVYQSQKKAKIHKSIKSNFDDMGFNYGIYNYRDDGHDQFTISNKDFVLFMREHFGHGSHLKCIPTWLKNIPKEYLETLLFALVEGDGSVRTTDLESYSYSSVSKQLIDDVQEIALKCGFSAKSWVQDRNDQSSFGKSVRYWVHFGRGKNSNGSFPVVRKQHINKVPYKGKVWCFTTSTGFFVTRRNGKIAIQGNSGYQSAQVGVETLIRRIEAWRQTLAEWAEERIFKPIAEMQGFVDEKESEEVGETVFLYPTIKWNELELKDKTQFHQLLNQLHDKQVISTQTLLEEFGFDYDQEVMRMRYEQAQAGPAGAMMPGAEGGAGGMPMGGGGGMPGAEGGAGGGMPGMGMDPMGGAGGGMDMGGGGGMGGMPAAAGGGKVTKKGKSNTSDEEEAVPMVPIKLTKIEQKMAGMLNEVATTMGFSASNIRMQYPFANPKGGKPFTMDFAFPTLKVDIEADGEIWHSGPEKMQHDKDRDYLLAQRGWTVLRFDDKVIEEAPHQVKATINSYIKKSMESTQKIASGNNGVQLSKMVGYFISEGGELKDLQGNAVKYYKVLESTHDDRVLTSTTFGDRSSDEYFSTSRKI